MHTRTCICEHETDFTWFITGHHRRMRAEGEQACMHCFTEDAGGFVRLSIYDNTVGKFRVTAMRQDPSLSLVDALLEQPKWAGTLGDDDVRALRWHEAELHTLDVEWRAHKIYSMAAHRRSAARRRHVQGSICDDCCPKLLSLELPNV